MQPPERSCKSTGRDPADGAQSCAFTFLQPLSMAVPSIPALLPGIRRKDSVGWDTTILQEGEALDDLRDGTASQRCGSTTEIFIPSNITKLLCYPSGLL